MKLNLFSREYQLRKEGYSQVRSFHELELEAAKDLAKSLRVDKSKACVVREVSFTRFRDRTEKNVHWVVYELPSALTLHKREMARAAERQQRRTNELMKIAEELTMKEALDIVSMVSNRIETTKEI